MLPIKACCIGIFLLATQFMLTCCSLDSPVLIESFPNSPESKLDDTLAMHKRPSFFVGSRYGRSGGGPTQTIFAASKARRLNVVPRNDRFFLGSRYGKRVDEYMSPYEQDAALLSPSSLTLPAKSTAIAETPFENASAIENDNGPYIMSCTYTGRRNYYRCHTIERINHFINRLANSHTTGEDNNNNDDDDDDDGNTKINSNNAK